MYFKLEIRMKKMNSLVKTMFLITVLSSLGACADLTPTQRNVLGGAALGTVVGAGVGAISGGDAGTGAAVGAAVGAVGGALVTDE